MPPHGQARMSTRVSNRCCRQGRHAAARMASQALGPRCRLGCRLGRRAVRPSLARSPLDGRLRLSHHFREIPRPASDCLAGRAKRGASRGQPARRHTRPCEGPVGPAERAGRGGRTWAGPRQGQDIADSASRAAPPRRDAHTRQVSQSGPARPGRAALGSDASRLRDFTTRRAQRSARITLWPASSSARRARIQHHIEEQQPYHGSFHEEDKDNFPFAHRSVSR